MKKFAEETEPVANSAASEDSGNHPENAWQNVLFIDGHAGGGPGKADFAND